MHSRPDRPRIFKTERIDHACHVFAWDCRGPSHGVALQKDVAQGTHSSADHGIAALQTASGQNCPQAYVGSIKTFCAARGDGDSWNQHPALVPGELPKGYEPHAI